MIKRAWNSWIWPCWMSWQHHYWFKLWKLMDHEEEAYTKCKDLSNCCKSNDEICKLFLDTSFVIQTLDAATADIHSIANHAEKAIFVMVAQLRRMGENITTESHGFEKHAIFPREIPEGIGMLIKHWTESYHQIGNKYDLTYCQMFSTTQAETWSQREKIIANPQVVRRKALLKIQISKKTRGRKWRKRKMK